MRKTGLLITLLPLLVLVVSCQPTPDNETLIASTSPLSSPSTTPTFIPPTATVTPVTPTPTLEPGTGTVLLIFGDRFISEIYETIRPKFEEAGYDVVVASRALEPIRAKIADLEVEVDLLLEDVKVEDYDAIVFTCDNDITFGSALDETNRIAQEASEQGILLAAVCSGPRILAYAQVVEGKTVTGEPSQTCQMLEQAGATCTGHDVERDGLLITARDRYASGNFAQTIIEALQESSTEESAGDSEEGLLVFYSEQDGNAEIYTMQADGREAHRLTFNSFEDSSPVWSPDGLQIAFISDRDDSQAGGCFPNCLYQLYMMNADGSDEHKFIETEFTVHHPDWHPDGTRLSFDTEFNLQGDVYVVDADGSDLQLLVEDGFWVDWSPDGTQIAYASNWDGNVEIYLANADGSNQRRLTNNTRMDFFPAWSPDGEKIAFMAGDGHSRQIYIMDANGSNEQQLTFQGQVNEDPVWSPDGKRIAFQSNRDGNYEIYSLNVEETLAGNAQPQQLTDSSSGDYWPSWRPIAISEAGVILFEKSDQTFASIPTWKIGLADLDGDDDLDAVFPNSLAYQSQVWLNDGNGNFIDTGQQLGKYGHGVDVGDVDGDGDPDLVITTHEFVPTRVFLNDGTAVFQELDEAFSETTGHSVDLYDLDGDGDLDAVGEGRDRVSLFFNDGRGYFTASETNFPMTSVWGDLDSDGDVDVLIKEDSVGYTVHLNDGAGTFSPDWTWDEPTAMDIGDMVLGDLDGDGDLDVVITNGFHQSTSYPARVFLNDGNGQFSDSAQQLSTVASAGASLGDLDGDGDLDLVLTDYLKPCQIWLNDGSGRFLDSGFRFGDGQFYRHTHLGDLDGDGDLDIFLATFGLVEGPNEIWFNQGP